MSQQIDRLVASRGPAMVTYNGGVFFSKEDIVIDLNKETKEIPSSAFGPLTEVNLGVKATTKFTPVGEFEHLGVLWPYGATIPGTSIFGAADLPLLIQPLDEEQDQVTFHAAGISKMPDLNFTAADSLIGEVEFQMIGKNNVAVDNANRLFTFATNAIDLEALPYDPEALIIEAYDVTWLSAGTWHPSYNADDTTAAIAYSASAGDAQTALRTIAALSDVVVTGNYQGYTLTKTGLGTAVEGDPDIFTAVFSGFPGGSSLRADVLGDDSVLLRLYPWSKFATREGMKVAFNLSLEEDTSDAIGHYDTIFRSLSVSATAIPQGVSDADALAAALLQGASSVRGRKLSTGAHNLVISGPGSGISCIVYGAQLKKSPLAYSSSKQRVGQLEWVASRSVAIGGELNPLFEISAA